MLALVVGFSISNAALSRAFRNTERILAFISLLNYSSFIIENKFALILFKMTCAQHPKDKIDIFL